MDKLLFVSFVTIFSGALESVIARALSAYGLHHLGEQVDFFMTFAAPLGYIAVSTVFMIRAILGRRKDRSDTIERHKDKQNGVDRSLFIENKSAVEAVLSQSGFIEMHSSDDLHLVEEVIDDLSAVEEFEKEATKIQPLVKLAELQKTKSSRSIFHS